MFAGRDSQQRGRGRLRGLQEDHEEVEGEMIGQRMRFEKLADPGSAPQVFSSFNLFPTPPDVAEQVIDLADIRTGHKVLEPSAGTGNLIRAISNPYQRHIEVTAVEVDSALWQFLSNAEFAIFTSARLADFLTWEPHEYFDRVVMNPPFKMGTDIKHIRRAIDFLKPGGRLVSVCANGPKQQAALQPIATRWIELPPGSFKSEGTNVNAAIFVYEKE